ncbi:MAG: multidrug efflux SMR transporter [Pirellulaceae bacterium]
MSWFYLAIAIVCEITATAMLKATDSFTRIGPSVVVVACVCASLYFFSLCVQSLNVAVVYAIWSGVGVTAVTVLGWKFYGQRLDLPAFVGISLIVIGVVVINLYSQTINIP